MNYDLWLLNQAEAYFADEEESDYIHDPDMANDDIWEQEGYFDD